MEELRNKYLEPQNKNKFESEYAYMLETHGVHVANGFGYLTYHEGHEFVQPEQSDQGLIYKDYDAWIYGGVVYIPEAAFMEIEPIQIRDLPGDWYNLDEIKNLTLAYEKQDFLDIVDQHEIFNDIGVHFNMDLDESREADAFFIFDIVDWQLPETYAEEFAEEQEISFSDLLEESTESKDSGIPKTPELDKLKSWSKGYVVAISACKNRDCSNTSKLKQDLNKYTRLKSDGFWLNNKNEIEDEESFLVHITDAAGLDHMKTLGSKYSQVNVYAWALPIKDNHYTTGTKEDLGYGTVLDGNNIKITKAGRDLMNTKETGEELMKELNLVEPKKKDNKGEGVKMEDRKYTYTDKNLTKEEIVDLMFDTKFDELKRIYLELWDGKWLTPKGESDDYRGIWLSEFGDYLHYRNQGSGAVKSTLEDLAWVIYTVFDNKDFELGIDVRDRRIAESNQVNESCTLTDGAANFTESTDKIHVVITFDDILDEEELKHELNVVEHILALQGLNYITFKRAYEYDEEALITQNAYSKSLAQQIVTAINNNNSKYISNATAHLENEMGAQTQMKTMTFGQLQKDIIELRKEIILNSVFLHDYDNSLGYDPHKVYTFFDGYAEYLDELIKEDGKDWAMDLDEYDTEDNLIAYLYFFDYNPLSDAEITEQTKLLTEGTGNFTMSDYGFPTFALMEYEWALHDIYYYMEHYDTADMSDEELEELEYRLLTEMSDKWGSLPDGDEVKEAMDKIEDEILGLWQKTLMTLEAQTYLGEEKYWEEENKDWTLYDEYSYEIPKVEIAPGYYEGASIIIDIPYIELIRAYDLGDNLAEIMVRHLGKDGLGLGELMVTARFSSGETHYKLKKESRNTAYELQARYDSRNSFYGKAIVVHEADGTVALISYNTRVAEIKDNVAKVMGTYSATTLRHIKEFLLQHGFRADSKSQIMKDYM